MLHCKDGAKWQITYYSKVVLDEIQRLPKLLSARYLALANRMSERGPDLGMPHTKALGDGLFELRVKAVEGIARVFYCTLINHEIVMLHSFIKKTTAIPKRELVIARKRLKEVK